MAEGRKTGGRQKGVPNKATRDIKALAQNYGPAAIKRLFYLMEHAESEGAQVAAIKELLDRGYCKAAQPVTGADGEGPVRHSLKVEFVKK